MSLLKLLSVLLVCMACVSPARAQAAYDDADAQLRVRQAATAAGEAARKVEAVRKALETEKQRVVATGSERDLNRTAIRTLEQELQAAEARQREQDAALRAAQDARARGLEQERQRQPVQAPPAPSTPPPAPAPRSVATAATQFDGGLAAYRQGDYATALRLWRPMAAQGDARAQAALGALYEFGQGVAQDIATAVSWYRKAAEQGNADAQNNLALMYARALGVPKDFVQAHMWFNLAAARGHAGAATPRDEVTRQLNPSQLAEAQRLAREWRPK